jgi:hypothetical protein
MCNVPGPEANSVRGFALLGHGHHRPGICSTSLRFFDRGFSALAGARGSLALVPRVRRTAYRRTGASLPRFRAFICASSPTFSCEKKTGNGDVSPEGGGSAFRTTSFSDLACRQCSSAAPPSVLPGELVSLRMQLCFEQLEDWCPKLPPRSSLQVAQSAEKIRPNPLALSVAGNKRSRLQSRPEKLIQFCPLCLVEARPHLADIAELPVHFCSENQAAEISLPRGLETD